METEQENKAQDKGKEVSLANFAGLKEEKRAKPVFDKLTLAKITDVKTFIHDEIAKDRSGAEYRSSYLQVFFDVAGTELVENYNFSVYADKVTNADGVASTAPRPWLGKESSMRAIMTAFYDAFGKGADLETDFKNMIGKECYIKSEERRGSMKQIIKNFKI